VPAFFSIQDRRELENFSISPASQIYDSLSRYAFPGELKRIVITFKEKNNNIAAAATYSLMQI